MTIPYFSSDQMDVFIPAMLAGVTAVAALTLPVIFWPRLAKSAGRVPVLAISGVIAAAAIVVTVILAVPGFHTLDAQGPSVQRQIEHRYGVRITEDDTRRLIDGNKFKIPETGVTKELSLRLVDGGTYILTSGGLSGELPLAG